MADRAKEDRVEGLVRDLDHLVGPGASVQVMDVTEGGIHALLRLHSRQPTPTGRTTSWYRNWS